MSVRKYSKVYGKQMSSNEVSEVADEIIRKYKKKQIPYVTAMKQINFMGVLSYSKGWKKRYSGDIMEIRAVVDRKKKELKNLAGR